MQRLLFLLLLMASSALAQERLVVFGGGANLPEEALVQFTNWAQEKGNNILVIPWATKHPAEYANAAKARILRHVQSAEFTVAPSFPMTPKKKALFLKQLEQATGVFFTGGGQARILETIQDDEIRSALTQKFKSGTPFAGTSAGTAIMSGVIIVDEEKPTKFGDPNLIVDEGLCFLPSNVVIDQHFIIRNREARLRFLMLGHPGKIGLGVDEDMGFVIEDGVGKAVGKTAVIVLTPNGKVTLKNGDKFNLKTVTRE